MTAHNKIAINDEINSLLLGNVSDVDNPTQFFSVDILGSDLMPDVLK